MAVEDEVDDEDIEEEVDVEASAGEQTLWCESQSLCWQKGPQYLATLHPLQVSWAFLPQFQHACRRATVRVARGKGPGLVRVPLDFLLGFCPRLRGVPPPDLSQQGLHLRPLRRH